MKYILNFWKIPFILLLALLIYSLSSCNMKAGNTMQVTILKHTAKLEGKEHRLMYGVRKGPLKVEYFKLHDTIPAGKDTLIVVNPYKLNRKMAYYEQGFRNLSLRQLNKIFYKYCKVK